MSGRQKTKARSLALAFGTALRTTRLEQGLSQERLSELTDMDRTYPSLLERGLRAPTLAMVFRMATALQVAPEFMVARTARELAGGVS
ncbi:MAG: family transcriptional regulator [Gammaproteobacteria bacterium]|nr:family transcriptional regulator [Gammaproteobacteria bacterium]